MYKYIIFIIIILLAVSVTAQTDSALVRIRVDVDSAKVRLNNQEILEDWEKHHAVREVIANAIDEELLSKTKKIRIFKDNKKQWHIRDYGRGLLFHCLHARADHPASTLIIVPVRARLFSEANQRAAWATSCGVIGRS